MATMTAGKHAVEVQENLQAVAGRIRMHDLTVGGLLMAVALLAYVAAMVTLDKWLTLDASLRQLGWVVLVVGLGVIAHRFLWQPLRQIINPLYAAKRAEETVDDAKNSVVNWVDLHDAAMPESVRQAVAARAARHLANADPSRAAESKVLIYAGSAVAGLVVILAVLFLTFKPTVFASLVGRALNPFSSSSIAARTSLTLLQPAGDVTITAGTPITIAVTVDGREPDASAPDRLRVLLRHNLTTESFEEVNLEYAGNREWSVRVPQHLVQNGFWYRVTGGDASTAEHKVTVRPRPVFTAYEVKYDYPTHHNFKSETSKDPHIEAYRGTVVTITAKANRDLKDGRMVVADVPTPVVGTVSGDTLTVKFTLMENGTYRLFFTATTDEVNSDASPYLLRVLTDAAPVVTFKPTQAEEMSLPSNGLLTIDADASDDFGVENMTLKLRVAGKVTEKPYRKGKSFRREADGTWPTSVEYKDSVKLEGLGLKEKDVIEYWLEATDNCTVPKANVGKSKVLKVTLGPPLAADEALKDQADKDQRRGEDETAHKTKQDAKNDTEPRPKQAGPQEKKIVANETPGEGNNSTGWKPDDKKPNEGTEPKGTEPKGTEPKGTEPKGTEPKGTEPKSTEPKGTEPKGTEPKGTEPKGTEPKGTEPKGTEPKGTEPKGTEPKGTEPKGTEPKGTEPKGTEPKGTEPKGTEPKGTEPKGTEPKGTEPKGTEPKGTEPKGTEPKGTEPKGTEPKGTEPKGTEPKGTEPKGTEPKGTEPKGTEPQGTEPKTKDPRGGNTNVGDPRNDQKGGANGGKPSEAEIKNKADDIKNELDKQNPQGGSQNGGGGKPDWDKAERELSSENPGKQEAERQEAARKELEKQIGRDRAKEAESLFRDKKTGTPEQKKKAEEELDQLKKKVEKEQQQSGGDGDQKKGGEGGDDLQNASKNMNSGDPGKQGAAGKAIDQAMQEQAKKEADQLSKDLNSKDPATQAAAEKKVDELKKKAEQNAKNNPGGGNDSAKAIDDAAKGMQSGDGPQKAAAGEAMKKAMQEQAKKDAEQLGKDLQSKDAATKAAADQKLNDLKQQAAKNNAPLDGKQVGKAAEDAKSKDEATRKEGGEKLDKAARDAAKAEAEQLAKDLNSKDAATKAAAEKKVGDTMKEMAKNAKPGEPQPKGAEDLAKDLNSPDGGVSKAAKDAISKAMMDQAKKQADQLKKDLASEDPKTKADAEKQVNDLKAQANDLARKDMLKNAAETAKQNAEIMKAAKDLASKNEEKKQAAREKLDEMLGKENRDKIEKELKDQQARNPSPEKQQEMMDKLEQNERNMKDVADMLDALKNMKPSSDPKPGGPPAGADDPGVIKLQPVDQEALKRAGQLQLEKFKKERGNEELLKKLGYTQADYDRFLEGFEKMVNKPPEEIKLPPTDPARVVERAFVEKLNTATAGRVETRPGVTASSPQGSGPAYAPSGYSEAQKKFLDAARKAQEQK